MAVVTLIQADCALGHGVQSPPGPPALPQLPSPGEPASLSERKNSILGPLPRWDGKTRLTRAHGEGVPACPVGGGSRCLGAAERGRVGGRGVTYRPV